MKQGGLSTRRSSAEGARDRSPRSPRQDTLKSSHYTASSWRGGSSRHQTANRHATPPAAFPQREAGSPPARPGPRPPARPRRGSPSPQCHHPPPAGGAGTARYPDRHRHRRCPQGLGSAPTRRTGGRRRRGRHRPSAPGPPRRPPAEGKGGKRGPGAKKGATWRSSYRASAFLIPPGVAAA